jgi:hypothetical protein
MRELLMIDRFRREHPTKIDLLLQGEHELTQQSGRGFDRAWKFLRRRGRPQRTDPRTADQSVLPGHDDIPAGGTSGGEIRRGGGPGGAA